MASILAVSCNSDEYRIRKAAQGYLDATGNYRIDEAMPYATQATREQTLPFIRDIIIPLTDSNYINSNQPATIVIDSVHVVCPDTATVDYTKTTPVRILKNTIVMVKEDGKWLVHVPLDVPQAASSEAEDNNIQTDAQ